MVRFVPGLIGVNKEVPSEKPVLSGVRPLAASASRSSRSRATHPAARQKTHSREGAQPGDWHPAPQRVGEQREASLDDVQGGLSLLSVLAPVDAHASYARGVRAALLAVVESIGVEHGRDGLCRRSGEAREPTR